MDDQGASTSVYPKPPSREHLRLHLGELTADEARIAQAAYRLALIENRRTPAAQDAAQGREVLAVGKFHAEPDGDWTIYGMESGDACEECIPCLVVPATPTTNSGEIGRKLVVDVAAVVDVDALAQEIRRVDGNHSLGAGALAEALMPFLRRLSRMEGP
jgi:hypothetical protein